MKEKFGSLRDMINDALFITAGRIVNLYSNQKKKEFKDIICSNELKYGNIENYDLTI